MLLSATARPATVPTETAQTIVAHDDDIVPLHTSVKETTLIVLPEKEKAMGVFCGDKSYWAVDVIPGAERYIAVKPAKAGVATDIHIVTDHNNSYTLKAIEINGSNANAIDLKMFLKPADASSLEKPPVFVSAAEAERLKQELADAQAQLRKVQESAKAQVKDESDKLHAEYPDKMRFDYEFKRDKAPFHIESIWADDKFTYIRAHPEEAPTLYEMKDSHPSLIQFSMLPDGLYFIPKVLESGYLRVGKQETIFTRKRN